MTQRLIHVQAHRGARSLKPENTLPACEAALDLGVSSIETDLHLSRDRVLVIHHDWHVASRRIEQMTAADLRQVVADGLCPAFPTQDFQTTPLAQHFAQERGRHPFSMPTLEELLLFVAAYAGDAGRKLGKTERQQDKARTVRLDLEIKTRPLEGSDPARWIDALAAVCGSAPTSQPVCVRSFDHRLVKAVKEELRLRTGILIANTAPVDPWLLVQSANADEYYPEYLFLDEAMVGQLRTRQCPIIAWTVNDPADWQRLLSWQVDGITTDDAPGLIRWLHAGGWEVA